MKLSMHDRNYVAVSAWPNALQPPYIPWLYDYISLRKAVYFLFVLPTNGFCCYILALSTGGGTAQSRVQYILYNKTNEGLFLVA